MTDLLLDQLIAPNLTQSGAIFSDCKKYRYLLWRMWDFSGSHIAFIGFNPSTADATADDPTIRKCRGFAERWGYGGFEMLNLFAFRSTDPLALWVSGAEPVGSYNDAAVDHAMSRVRVAVAAWGAIAAPNRGRRVLRTRIETTFRLAMERKRELKCLGTSKDGHPRHPLYMTYGTELEPWRPDA